MAGNRKEIDAKSPYIRGNLADGLGCVCVKQNAMLMSNAGAIFNWLNRPNLVVGVHDADENRAWCNRLVKVAWINAAGAVDGQIGHPRAQAFEKPARFDDRRVLDPSGDDVIALLAQGEEYALEGKIVCLATAARENYFNVVAAEQCCDLAARDLQARLCLDRSPMPA